MDKEQQLKHFEELYKQASSVMASKGDDYAGQDRLNNFRSAGAACSLTAQQNCLSLIATKVARLGNLYSSGRLPNNEAVQDSILDLFVYSALLHMIEIDSKKVPVDSCTMKVHMPIVTSTF